jgi:hypothetical protein
VLLRKPISPFLREPIFGNNFAIFYHLINTSQLISIILSFDLNLYSYHDISVSFGHYEVL